MELIWLLSQALVASTVEIDNAFEQRMPTVTTIGGRSNAAQGIAQWGYAPLVT